MFGNKHHTHVWPARRGYQYRCTCGATGWTTSSWSAAEAAGKQHEQNAKK